MSNRQRSIFLLIFLWLGGINKAHVQFSTSYLLEVLNRDLISRHKDLIIINIIIWKMVPDLCHYKQYVHKTSFEANTEVLWRVVRGVTRILLKSRPK